MDHGTPGQVMRTMGTRHWWKGHGLLYATPESSQHSLLAEGPARKDVEWKS
jgi:hypothetical protein